MPQQTDAAPLRQLGSQYINRRRFRLAVDTFIAATEHEPDNPHGWMGLAIAHNLLGQAHEADTAWQHARQCPGYTTTMEGDELRDRARTAVIIGLLDLAENYLREADRLHAGDASRVACLEGMWGRWHFARGEFAQALHCHLAAHLEWQRLGEEANKQWVYNNLLPMMRAAAALSEQSLRELLAAHGAQRTWKHIVLGGTTVLVPILGWRVVSRLKR